MGLAQTVSDLSLRSGAAGRVGQTLRRALLRRDPTVAVTVRGTRMLAPLSHQLPHYCRAFPRYAEQVETIARLAGDVQERPTMIDVGANIGDTALIAVRAEPRLRVICFEPLDIYQRLLARNTAGEHAITISAHGLLGSSTGKAAVEADGTGTGRVTHQDGGSQDVISLDDALVDHPAFASPTVLKTDTDGFDGHVLRGAERTLRAARPIIFTEWHRALLAESGTDPDDLRAWLTSLGYGPTVAYNNFGDPIAQATLEEVPALDRALHGPDHYLDLAIFPGDRRQHASRLYLESNRGISSVP